jgi:N-acetyl-anhydromuramoyl-L-alanine amidase
MSPPVGGATASIGAPASYRLAPRGRRRWQGGWLRGARWCASPNANERPAGMAVELVVIHSISLPPGDYGGPGIEALFTNRLDRSGHPFYAGIHQLRVSAHFVIRRDGELVQFVDADRRAWHAGVSSWKGRSVCNDFSIGIELEGSEGGSFEDRQYHALMRLLRDLRTRYPLRAIAGHEHIAPGRKTDPGPGFDGRSVARAMGLEGAWPEAASLHEHGSQEAPGPA